MRATLLLGAAVLLALSACREQEAACANLLGAGRYCLQTTTALSPFDVQQKVQLLRPGQSETLIVDLEVDPHGMRMVGLTPLGQKLIGLSYDNRTITASTPPHERLSPSLLLALLQIALWPPQAVREGLQAPLTLETSESHRRIMNGATPILTIHHGKEAPPYRQMQMTLPAANLELRIETLDNAGLTDTSP